MSPTWRRMPGAPTASRGIRPSRAPGGAPGRAAGGAPGRVAAFGDLTGASSGAGRFADVALAGVGFAVGVAFAGATALRRAKPIHTRGAVVVGRLHRDGTGRSGVAWIDARADDDVLVRLSRSVGLPAAWPDVHGLAIRQETAGWDVLLSTTFAARGGRHVLRPGFRPDRGTYSSLVPFRGPRGPVLIAAQPPSGRRLPADPEALADDVTLAPVTFTLAWAHPGGPWLPFGTLEVGTRADLLVSGARGADLPVRFDPLRTPPGLETYGWVARVREPAYVAARRRHPVDAGAVRPRIPTQRSAP